MLTKITIGLLSIFGLAGGVSDKKTTHNNLEESFILGLEAYEMKLLKGLI